MPFAIQSALDVWRFPIALTVSLALAAFIYLRGWFRIHSTQPRLIPSWRAGSFLCGLALIWLALGSPLALFDEQLLTVHMIQHLLLMTFAPALLLLGSPVLALLNGLPRDFVQRFLGPLFKWSPVHNLGRTLVRPAVSWFAAAAALVVWHIPAVFTLALRSEPWHVVEHATFFLAGFLFWWPVIQPTAPARPQWSMILYLFLATIPCDILSAFLVFGDRIAYPAYLATPRPFQISVVADQQFAGALMWTCITLFYLVPATILTLNFLSTGDVHRHDGAHGHTESALHTIETR